MTKVTIEFVKSLDTPQKMFDHIVSHLVKQGKPSVHIDNKGRRACMYRSPDGCMCAAGAVIPDEYYLESFEGWNISNPLGYGKVRDLLGDYRVLLTDLQHVHDRYLRDDVFSMSSLQHNLESVSEKHNLEFKAEGLKGYL